MRLERRERLKALLIEHAIYRLKQGETMTLASGKVIEYPNYYADLRLLCTVPEALPLLAEAYIHLMPDDIDYIGAVPTGGLIPLGAVGYRLGQIGASQEGFLFYVRSSPKGHGAGKQVEGYLTGDAPACVIEDVVTSGGSLIKAIEAARRERNAQISTAICILDREMGGAEALAGIGVELRSIFLATELGLK